jgi:Tc toxin complex TcA C-terminal TcB-binding domain/Neuraminidase-like domain/Salmonella virulence plasmid 28.1kDa A protein
MVLIRMESLEPRQAVIRGVVTDVNGRAMAGVDVRVFARRLRGEEFVAATRTGDIGDFQVGCAVVPSLETVRLTVRISDAQGSPLAEATVSARPGEDQRIDLVTAAVLESEFDGMLARVGPLLGGTPLVELAEDDRHRDISFLAEATGLDGVQIAQLVLAHRHAQATGLAASMFYGLLRRGLPGDLSAMARYPRDGSVGALRAAAEGGVISALGDGEAEALVDRLRELEAAKAAEREEPGAGLAGVIRVAVADPEARRMVHARFLENGGDTLRWLAALGDEDGLTGHVERLRLALRLGEFTANSPRLVAFLLAKFDSGEIVQERDLAWLTEAEWREMVARTGGAPAGAVDERAYAAAVHEAMTAAHPTPQILRRLGDDPGLAGSPAARFLAANPQFDLRSSSVEAAVRGSLPGGVDAEELRADLGSLQRVLKFAPSFEDARILRAAGIGSAYQVARMGRASFVRAFGGELGEGRAREVHERAAQAHAMAAHLIAQHHSSGQVGLAVLAAGASPTAAIPNWESLFGSPDFAACADCRSVLSPAAYLADLLHFLKSRQDADPANTPVKDVLLRRRPDLAVTELSCDNAGLTLPYVDLVNEILERAVAPTIDFTHPLTPEERAGLQTSGSAEELRASPQHVDAAAYATLALAPYPWDLPFDLWSEQVRTWLGQLGVRRHELMRSLRAPTVTDLDIAAEYLGIPVRLRMLITGETATPPVSQAECYGFPAATADLVTPLAPVRAFLDITGLGYPDLLELLRMRFVNPGGAMRLVSADPAQPETSDTTKLRIDQLDTAALDRVHRFVRLYRVLGWTPRRLDRAIAAFTPGRLSTDTFLALAGVHELGARLGLAVERLLIFYAAVDTYDQYAADDVSLYDQVFLSAAVTGVASAASPLRLRPDRTELAVIGDLGDRTVAAILLGSLAVTQDELTALVSGPYAVVTADHLLNLANLSTLLRTVTLARALQLPVPDLVRLMALSGAHPFPTRTDASRATAVAATRDFAVQAGAVTASGFTVAETAAVLTANADPAAGLPDDAAISTTLADLRAALATVFQQTAATTDATGELCGKQLARLGWDAWLVDQAIGTLLGNITYTAPLAALPAGVVLPPGMGYDAGVLSGTGPMTTAALAALQTLSADQLYRDAVLRLFDAPRQFLATRMRGFTPPTVIAPLAALPPGLAFPATLAGGVFYDPNQSTLCGRGYLRPDERDLLAGLSQDPAYQQAVTALITGQDTQPPAPGDGFLTAADAAALFDTPHLPAERFALVLVTLQPHLRHLLGSALVRQKIGTAAGLDPATADGLFGVLRRTPTAGLVLADLLDPAFVAGDPSVVPTATSAPVQVTALALVHRVTLLLRRLRIGADQLPWVFDDAAAAGWLNLADLPAAPVNAVPSPLYPAFARLLDLARLRDTIPGGADLLSAVFALARTPAATPQALLGLLAVRTGWDPADLALLTGPGCLTLTLPAAFTDERALTLLQACTAVLAHLGVSAALALSWAGSQPAEADADSAWQIAKARYSLADWATIAGPLRDVLRDRQRAALVSYLVAHPPQTPSGPAWSDAHELYQYFLVDVEMGPIQLTSRIVLATNSVQLFVQRCLLNLEPEVRIAAEQTGPDEWGQWDWLGHYRLWEANRRVFLYPENYFEPELRPDKSPFFAELENTLFRKDVTDEAVTEAYRTYLEKLDAVARLQPAGLYHQYKLDTTGALVGPDVLHVFARTWAAPHAYYYRQFVDGVRWTAWERVDLDVQGEHLMPVIWKGRLFLFWPLFVQTADQKPITMPAGGQQLADATKRWQVQFAWSERKNGKWQSKQLITQSLAPRMDDGDLAGNFLFLPDAEFVTDGKLSMACYKKKAVTSLQYTIGNVTLSSAKSVWTTEFQDPAQPGQPTPTIGAPPASTVHTGLEYVEQPDLPGGALGHALMIPTERGNPQTQHLLLPKTPGVVPFRILYPNHYANYPILPFMAMSPTDSFFFVDGTRAYFVIPNPPQPPAAQAPAVPAANAAEVLPVDPVAAVLARSSTPGLITTAGPVVPVKFTTFYHPFVEMLVGQLATGGVQGVLDRDVQLTPENFTGAAQPVTPFRFGDAYGDAQGNLPPLVIAPDPAEQIDFDVFGGYSLYNWELFFHAPLLLARRLSANQRFAEAQKWFHTIFNPTDRSAYPAPQRFWQTKPFFQTSTATFAAEQIENILEQLATNNPNSILQNMVREWRGNPFQPDLIARLRATSYQKAVVMKYLDNLIAWGDQLFRQNSMESITQATQLYVLAAEILGRRPDEITPRNTPAPLTYAELEPTLDSFSNELVAAEHLVPAASTVRTGSAPAGPTPSVATMLYFCVPRNDQLLGYWNTVTDRLFKIRHGLDIQGLAQQLPLTEPPINPALLVAATAAGQDVATALADIDAPLPYYRYAAMAARASELAAEVKALGAALLAALEKQDAEALARIRSGHELATLTAARDVRKQQVDEATAAQAALRRSRDIAVARQTYYATRPFMNDGESAHADLASSALDKQQAAMVIDTTANILGLIPDFKVGCPTTIGATFGGTSLVNALRAFSSALSQLAGIDNAQGAVSATVAGYQRRQDDWKFQAAQAGTEITQIDQQISAAQLRIDIAQKELDNQDQQIAHAREVDAFLRTKFSGQELYGWTVSQLADLYFQSYQLAYDLAKRAQQAYRFELADPAADFVAFGYWDSLHKGLLAGERLAADLKRMDASYTEQNRREYELTKRVSLAALDPSALLQLQQTGECFLSLSEALFDLDCPGHYLRRIKSVALTIPCVAGPYTSVNCTATLLRSSLRSDSTLLGGKYARVDSDPRFRDYAGAIQSMVTSTAQQDSGLFEFNLRDERYLPFEGSGVISDWHLSLPAAFRQFDYNTITDVILHIHYTAREGGTGLAAAATTELQAAVNSWVTGNGRRGLLRAISIRGEFGDQWNRLLNPSGIADLALTLPLSTDRFPVVFHDRTITVDHVQLALVLTDGRSPTSGATYRDAYAAAPPLTVTLTPPGASAQPGRLTSSTAVLNGTPTALFTVTSQVGQTPSPWTVTAARADIATIAAELRTADNRLNPEAIRDLVIIAHYTLS